MDYDIYEINNIKYNISVKKLTYISVHLLICVDNYY